MNFKNKYFLLGIAGIILFISLIYLSTGSKPNEIQNYYDDTYEKLEKIDIMLNSPVLPEIIESSRVKELQIYDGKLRKQFFFDDDSTVSKTLNIDQIRDINKDVSLFYSLTISEIDDAANNFFEKTVESINRLILSKNISDDDVSAFAKLKREIISYDKFDELDIIKKLTEIERIITIETQINRLLPKE